METTFRMWYCFRQTLQMFKMAFTIHIISSITLTISELVCTIINILQMETNPRRKLVIVSKTELFPNLHKTTILAQVSLILTEIYVNIVAVQLRLKTLFFH